MCLCSTAVVVDEVKLVKVTYLALPVLYTCIFSRVILLRIPQQALVTCSVNKVTCNGKSHLGGEEMGHVCLFTLILKHFAAPNLIRAAQGPSSHVLSRKSEQVTMGEITSSDLM